MSKGLSWNSSSIGSFQRIKVLKVFFRHLATKAYILIPNIKADNLGKSLKGRWIYRNLNFTIHLGESLLIQGPNGAGKSVLLQNLAGFWKADEGTITFEDFQEKAISFCPFHGGLDEFMKLKDALKTWIGDSKTKEALAFWGLENIKHKKVKSLSSGQYKRALLAKAFFINTKIILLDEPFVGIDKDYREVLIDVMSKRLEQESIIIFTGHRVELDHAFTPKTLNLTLS